MAPAGGRVLAGSARNWASLGDADALMRLAAKPERWAWFLESEVRLCAEPGVLDGSTHVPFAAAAASGSLPDQWARNRGPEGPLRAT